MAKEYLERLSAFIDRATSEGFGDAHLECRHFFSGAALYANGRICISSTPVGLALKLPEETKITVLENETAVPLRYFPNGPIKKDYALFTDGIENGGESLHEYVKESIKHALTLGKLHRK